MSDWYGSTRVSQDMSVHGEGSYDDLDAVFGNRDAADSSRTSNSLRRFLDVDASSSVHDMRPVDPDSSVVTGGSLGDDDTLDIGATEDLPDLSALDEFDDDLDDGCYEELDEWRIAADETDAGSALSDGGGDGHDSLWHEEADLPSLMYGGSTVVSSTGLESDEDSNTCTGGGESDGDGSESEGSQPLSAAATGPPSFHPSPNNVASAVSISNRGAASTSGNDVDAVRVVLLGVSDNGRPSVGIDLGFACTHVRSGAAVEASGGIIATGNSMDAPSTVAPAPDLPPEPTTARPVASSLAVQSSTQDASVIRNFSSSTPLPPVTSAPQPSRPPQAMPSACTTPIVQNSAVGVGRNPANGGSSVDVADSQAEAASGSGVQRLGGSTAAKGFVFNPPGTPSRKKRIWFSEHAGRSGETFLFQGAASTCADESRSGSTRAVARTVAGPGITAALADESFVRGVIEKLPGVTKNEERLNELMSKLRLRSPQSAIASSPFATPVAVTSARSLFRGIEDSSSPTKKLPTKALRPLLPRRTTELQTSWNT